MDRRQKCNVLESELTLLIQSYFEMKECMKVKKKKLFFE